MSLYRHVLRPLLFCFPPEAAHHFAIGMLTVAPFGGRMFSGGVVNEPVLRTMVGGISFDNPLGLAAGLDKSARAVHGLAAMGFGHVEVGSVSALPSLGNPKPRLWRLKRDRAILVHYGVPNDGADIVAERLMRSKIAVPVGVNIVKTNFGPEAPAETDEQIIADYLAAVRRLKDAGAYLVLNLSCPNTAHGRDFFSVPGNTRALLVEIAKLEITRPLFLKVGAPADAGRVDALLREVEGLAVVSGFAPNLTPQKPDGLLSPPQLWRDRPGAVSGRPAAARMNAAVALLYSRIDPARYQIIGSGGIFRAEDAYLQIRLGASLVQILTALIYEGPGAVAAINRGLARLIEQDGFKSVSEAVGTFKDSKDLPTLANVD